MKVVAQHYGYPAMEPVTNPATDPVTDPVTAPIADPITNPIIAVCAAAHVTNPSDALVRQLESNLRVCWFCMMGLRVDTRWAFVWIPDGHSCGSQMGFVWIPDGSLLAVGADVCRLPQVRAMAAAMTRMLQRPEADVQFAGRDDCGIRLWDPILLPCPTQVRTLGSKGRPPADATRSDAHQLMRHALMATS